ncbi:MAG: NYN domain-containing protein, partial [Nanoarchaeota archaeon]|nr:NYN domain-containing protein [Nanoarchaeota archaeon]
AMDMLRLSSKLDTVVLVSGDGDFVDLLRYLKSHGCRVEVMSFKKTCSSKLIDEADDFIALDHNSYMI